MDSLLAGEDVGLEILLQVFVFFKLSISVGKRRETDSILSPVACTQFVDSAAGVHFHRWIDKSPTSTSLVQLL